MLQVTGVDDRMAGKRLSVVEYLQFREVACSSDYRAVNTLSVYQNLSSCRNFCRCRLHCGDVFATIIVLAGNSRLIHTRRWYHFNFKFVQSLCSHPKQIAQTYKSPKLYARLQTKIWNGALCEFCHMPAILFIPTWSLNHCVICIEMEALLSIDFI